MTGVTRSARPRAPIGLSGRAIAGSVLVVLGLLLWALYRVAAGSEAHAYTAGTQQSYVTLEQGHKYWIGVPGGRSHLLRESGRDLRCRLSLSGGGSQSQSLALERSGTKATDAVASFNSTVGGRARLSCDGVFDAYIDNATGDPSGWALVAATILLTIGAPLLLSVGYTRWRQRVVPDPETFPITAKLR